MRSFSLIALLVAIAAPVGAWAEAGQGPLPVDKGIRRAAGAVPLDRIGDDVIRFSSSPALGGSGVVIEIHRRDGKSAVGAVRLLVGHRDQWTTLGTLAIEMPVTDFDALAGRVDALMDRGEPSKTRDGNIIVCTDGPGYVTERRSGGHSRWLMGFCGDHPNKEIATLMGRLAVRNFEQWWPGPDGRLAARR